ncbi:MAG: hypothetical protein C4326_05730 [Ignavibacteria bacterium]
MSGAGESDHRNNTTKMRSLKSFFISPRGNAALVALFAFLVYLKTLAPSVTFIDSGELAAVCCTLGIAHPTGYPLFTLLGWVFSRLPIAAEEIQRLNMMAALLCAAGIYFFYHLTHFVLTTTFSEGTGLRWKGKDMRAAGIQVASVGASLLLAFSETYWSQATSIEVYALHVLFLALVLLTFLKAVYAADPNSEAATVIREERRWYLFAFVLGLSFSNHMTTILLAPGLLYLYFASQGAGAESWRRIARLSVPFFVGLSAYLYLPLRASQSPLFNWGNPVTLERFLWHWTGKQYRVWIFSSTEAAARQFTYFVSTLPFEFAYAGIVVALIGAIAIWRGKRQLAITLVLLFVGCVLYSINYDIHDIDSYFLLAYVCIGLFAAAGLLVALRWLSERLRFAPATVAVLAVSTAPLWVHFQQADETDNYLVEDYTRNVFASLQPNALVLSFQWDYWVSASYYYQGVKGVRPDVAVVDKELLRRSWYFKQLERQHPWLIAQSRAEVEAFLRELDKFEQDRPYNPAVIQARFEEMIRSFLTNSMQTRPVYVTGEIEPEFTRGLQRVPEGLAYRLYADTLQHEMRDVEITYRAFARDGRLENGIRSICSSALKAQALYVARLGQLERGIMILEKALRFDPSDAHTVQLLSQMKVAAHQARLLQKNQ